MLVLSRQEGQSITITIDESVNPAMTVGELFVDNPIRIHISNMEGKKTRIATVSIDAPKELYIVRSELIES